MSEPARRPERMSLEEFDAADFGVGDLKVELIDGFVVIAQAFPTFKHGRMTGNLVRALGAALDRSNDPECHIETGTGIDVRLRHDFRLGPDVLVRCGGGFDQPGDPVVVIEVLSPSNTAPQMLQKLRAYQSVRSITDIVMLDQDLFYGQHYVRAGDLWQKPIELDGPDAIVRLRRPVAEIPLSLIYRDVLDPDRA
jgi:Uma2 family endonuclease